jgi:Allinase
MYTDWWTDDKTGSGAGTFLSADYRIGYQHAGDLSPGVRGSGIAPYLEKAIVDFHALVGNANAKDKHVVLGTGCTLLYAAAMFAGQRLYGRGGPSGYINVFAKAPYYDGYRTWADITPGVTRFTQAMNLTAEEQEATVEIVTYPNNPDGVLRKSVYPAAPMHVYDLVYFWPSIFAPQDIHVADFDIMLFSMSKLSGHAGSRFGWALVRNAKVAALMQEFIDRVEVQVSEDSQFRALNLLRSMTNGGPRGAHAFFKFIRGKMLQRWATLKDLFARQVQPASLDLLSAPGTCYAWIECTSPKDRPCGATLTREALVSGRVGPLFGASDAFVRLELVEHDSSFDTLVRNLNASRFFRL